MEINSQQGTGTLMLPDNRAIYGLAWNQAGTELYAVANDTPDASTLWGYAENGWQVRCEGLPKKIEGLETRPDGLLVYGFVQNWMA